MSRIRMCSFASFNADCRFGFSVTSLIALTFGTLSGGCKSDSATPTPPEADGGTVFTGEAGIVGDENSAVSDAGGNDVVSDAGTIDGSVDGGARDASVVALDPCRGTPLPPQQHYVAPGLCARAVATNQGDLRQITFTDNGDLIGVMESGAIVRYRDEDGNGIFAGASEIMKIADTGGNGNNAHLQDGYLYAGTKDGVRRWAYAAASNDLGTGEDVVVGEPGDGRHSLHTVHVYDGWLYVHSGSALNAASPAAPDYDTNRSVLKRFNLAMFTAAAPFQWSSGEVVIRGIRNMVGFTRAGSGKMYGVVNGLDEVRYAGVDVHNDNPGDDLIAIEAGGAHGYPYCFTASHVLTDGGLVAPGTQLAPSGAPTPPDPDFVNPNDDAWCAKNSAPPATFLPPHSAPLDIAFFDHAAAALPAAWIGGAFVTLHGSWDTTPSVGHEVVYVPFDAQGKPPMPQLMDAGTTFPFTVVFGGGSIATGPNDGEWSWDAGGDGGSDGGAQGESPVRPVGVAISPVDGALYISSDNGQAVGSGIPQEGALYRIGLAR